MWSRVWFVGAFDAVLTSTLALEGAGVTGTDTRTRWVGGPWVAVLPERGWAVAVGDAVGGRGCSSGMLHTVGTSVRARGGLILCYQTSRTSQVIARVSRITEATGGCMHTVVRQRSKVSAVNAGVVADDVFGTTGRAGLTGPITEFVVCDTQAVIHTCRCRSESVGVGVCGST